MYIIDATQIYTELQIFHKSTYPRARVYEWRLGGGAYRNQTMPANPEEMWVQSVASLFTLNFTLFAESWYFIAFWLDPLIK
jgi:hypothetical protein